ncbi:DUF3078 domain-containing protein [Cecembia sp.]|uniref:DUF3078 domain-containing protein n=1 Tax=Cecembia sp. TaxID=1898110 RepID=UPI0025BB3502|nr:DUF3078 domain-containing protein [Cecembia sp.]
MKKLFTLCLFFLTTIAFAQEVTEELMEAMEAAEGDTSYWDAGFSFGLNFNQASFSGNWRSGGVNSIAFGTLVTGKANYAKEKWSWDNQIELIYGLVKNEGQDFRKSNDRIFFDSKVGRSVSDHWSYFASVNFITQFTRGFDFSQDEPVLISNFFAPAFLTTGFGMEYKPNEAFALRLAPFSPRFTFVNDPNIITNVPENYGVPAGQTIRREWLAFQLFMTYNKTFNDNFTINSRYQMFANYETLAFNTIDHRLDVTLIAKINRYIDVTFTSINVYDIDMAPGIQISQALALGIVYKIGNE